MPCQTKPRNPKVIVFRFRNGPRDGEIVRSDQPSAILNEARTLYSMTRWGTTGKRILFPESEDAGHPVRRFYTVIGKEVTADDITVTCEYLGDG